MDGNARDRLEAYCPGLEISKLAPGDLPLRPSTALLISGAGQVAHLAPALARRAEVLALSQAAEEAALRPGDPGAWCHATRAALAARVARLNREDALADHHMAGAGDKMALGDPAVVGQGEVMRAVLSFIDAMSQDPRDLEAHDLNRMRRAGISDADIVRLTNLGAFLSFQLRLVAGLRLMAGVAA